MATTEEVETARQATRELREAIKDAKQAQKDLKKQLDESVERLMLTVDEQVGTIVAAGLEEYRDTLDKAIKEATAAIYTRFDKLTDVLLGSDPKSRARGDMSIPDLVDEVVAARKAGKTVRVREVPRD